MIRNITLLFITLFSIGLVKANECESAYQSGSYGVTHAETALEANNLEHLKQYAIRSKEAQEKVLLATEKCGCTDANNASYDSVQNLEKAVTADTFEMTRYYVKNAMTDAKAVLIALDLCRESSDFSTLDTASADLAFQEQQLLEAQQQLLAKQKKIEEQLLLQKKMQQQLLEEKKVKLQLQKELQLKAETELAILENTILEVLVLTECSQGKNRLSTNYKRSLSQLEEETLMATKRFYAEQAAGLANQLIEILQTCK